MPSTGAVKAKQNWKRNSVRDARIAVQRAMSRVVQHQTWLVEAYAAAEAQAAANAEAAANANDAYDSDNSDSNSNSDSDDRSVVTDVSAAQRRGIQSHNSSDCSNSVPVPEVLDEPGGAGQDAELPEEYFVNHCSNTKCSYPPGHKGLCSFQIISGKRARKAYHEVCGEPTADPADASTTALGRGKRKRADNLNHRYTFDVDEAARGVYDLSEDDEFYDEPTADASSTAHGDNLSYRPSGKRKRADNLKRGEVRDHTIAQTPALYPSHA